MSDGGKDIRRRYLGAAKKLGADSILSKPFRPADLIDLVARLLNSALNAKDN
jgi:CheY-like chemotaxis protein